MKCYQNQKMNKERVTRSSIVIKWETKERQLVITYKGAKIIIPEETFINLSANKDTLEVGI